MRDLSPLQSIQRIKERIPAEIISMIIGYRHRIHSHLSEKRYRCRFCSECIGLPLEGSASFGIREFIIYHHEIFRSHDLKQILGNALLKHTSLSLVIRIDRISRVKKHVPGKAKSIAFLLSGNRSRRTHIQLITHPVRRRKSHLHCKGRISLLSRFRSFRHISGYGIFRSTVIGYIRYRFKRYYRSRDRRHKFIVANSRIAFRRILRRAHLRKYE